MRVRVKGGRPKGLWVATLGYYKADRVVLTDLTFLAPTCPLAPLFPAPPLLTLPNDPQQSSMAPSAHLYLCSVSSPPCLLPCRLPLIFLDLSPTPLITLISSTLNFTLFPLSAAPFFPFTFPATRRRGTCLLIWPPRAQVTRSQPPSRSP